MEHSELNDYELIYLINEGNETAYNIMYDKYKGMVYKLAKAHYKNNLCNGVDLNDFILEGYIALDHALIKYNDSHKMKFQNFLFLCVDRQMKNLIRTNKAKKNMMLNNSIYYEDLNSNNIRILDTLEDKNAIQPDEALILNEEIDEQYNLINNNLSEFELKVFMLKKQGYPNDEIAKRLQKNMKSVSNALSRIKKKKNIININ